VPLGRVACALLAKFRRRFLEAPRRRRSRPLQPGLAANDGAAVQLMLSATWAWPALPMGPDPAQARHSYATHLLTPVRPAGSVQELLGHSHLVTTQIYTHVSIARLKDVYAKAHPGLERNVP